MVRAARKKENRRFLWERVWSYRESYVLLLPMLILVFIFSYVPIYGIIIAFKNYRIIDGITNSPWVGLLYFRQMFATASFMSILSNTVEISFLRILFGFPAPVILAILLNEIRHRRYKKMVQTISYLPYFMSWVVLGSIFRQLFQLESGSINQMLVMLGGEPVEFLTSNFWFRVILISTGVWQGVGWASVIYLAAISNIDTQLYEAAVIDGASRLQMVWHITLPFLYPVMSILLILSMGGILTAGFDQIFNLYNPTVYASSDILDTYVYRLGFGRLPNYSLSTAVNLFKNVVGFVLVILMNVLSKKMSGEGIW